MTPGIIPAVAARKDGKKNAPGQGRPEKPDGATVDRKNVSLYPWEWALLLRSGEGPTEAVRRLIYGSLVFRITGRQNEIGEPTGCWIFATLIPNAFTRARAAGDVVTIRFKVPHRLEGWEYFALEGSSVLRRYRRQDEEYLADDQTVSFRGVDLSGMLARIFAPE